MIGAISGQAGPYLPTFLRAAAYFSGFLGKRIALALRALGYGGREGLGVSGVFGSRFPDITRSLLFFALSRGVAARRRLAGVGSVKLLTKSPESISCRLEPKIVNFFLGKVPHHCSPIIYPCRVIDAEKSWCSPPLTTSTSVTVRSAVSSTRGYFCDITYM